MLVAACGSSGSSSGSNAPPSVSDEEQQYIDALGMAKTFTVAGRRLDLYRADRGYAVSFTR